MFYIASIILLLVTLSNLYANSGPRLDAILIDEVVGPPGWNHTDFNGINLKINHHHVPCIQETSPGKFVVVWYISDKRAEKDLHIAICCKHGKEWAKPSVIIPKNGGYNPGLLQPKRDPKASLYLYSRKLITADGFVYESPDDGIHWRVPPDGKLFKNISEAGAPETGLPLPKWKGICTKRFMGLIKNPGLELPDGSVFIGSSTQCSGWKSHIEVAPYGNYTGANVSAGKWSLISGIGPFIQPSFLVLSDDYKKLRVTGRVLTPRNALVTSASSDGGKTWGETKLLKNVGEQGHCSVTLDNGYHVVLGEEVNRKYVILAISKNGVDMEDVLHLQAKDNIGGAYPVVIQASDRKIHVVYASYSKNPKAHIRHVVLDPDVLVGKTADGGPSISTHPKAAEVELGSVAEFSVTASGSGTLYYQWQRNTGKGLWFNLGRSATLKTETAKEEMNNWEYRCVVTDKKGSSVSNTAKLSIPGVGNKNRRTYPGIHNRESFIRIKGGMRFELPNVRNVSLFNSRGCQIQGLKMNGNTFTVRRSAGHYFLKADSEIYSFVIMD
jgi:hypothetical protein